MGNKGIIGEPLKAGAEGKLNEGYIGAGVVKATVTLLTCDHVRSQEFVRDTPVPVEE